MTDPIIKALAPDGPLAAMAAFPQFVIYELRPKSDHPGKMDKVPVLPVKWGDRSSLLTSAQAIEAFTGWTSQYGHGIGFVFTAEDPFFFLDMDSYLSDGQWLPLVGQLATRLAGCAVEVSSSRKGIHIFGMCDKPLDHAPKNIPLRLELYTQDRFVALTGLQASGDCSTYAGPAVAAIAAEFFKPQAGGGVCVWGGDGPRDDWDGPADDADLIRAACGSGKARSAFGGGVSFSHLWRCDAERLGSVWPANDDKGDFDRSSADMSLASHLAFWTGCDAERMERLMRESGLARKKYDRPDYMQATINKAIAGCQDVIGSGRVDPNAPPMEWADKCVSGFNLDAEASELLAEMTASNHGKLSEKWADQTLPYQRLLPDLAYFTGSNPVRMAEMLSMRQGAPAIDDEVKGQILRAAQNKRSHRGVRIASEEQLQMADGIREIVDLKVNDGCLVFAKRVVVNGLPKIPGLYRQAGKLAQVDTHGGHIFTVGPGTLADLVETYWNVLKSDKPANCPKELISRIMESPAPTEIPEIFGVQPGPFARRDGSAVSTMGFDEQTGVYVLKGAQQPVRSLSPAEASAALARLREPFAEFPLCTTYGWSGIVAAMFSAVIRPDLPTCPGILVNAPQKGSGKSLITTMISLLAGGDESVAPLPFKPDERKQTITTIVKSGSPAFVWDNLEGFLPGSAELCTLLTSPMYRSRILSTNDEINIPQRTLWLFNGNNVKVLGDMQRRILLIPMISTPDVGKRIHSFDPAVMVTERRDAMRHDLLCLLETFRSMGSPQHGKPPYASFEYWDKVVRSCVVWLGLGDPLAASLAQEEEGDERDEILDVVLNVWPIWYGDQWVTSGQLFTSMTGGMSPSHVDPLTKERLIDVCVPRGGNVPKVRTLSTWLGHNENKWSKGRRIVRSENKCPSQNQYLYKVEIQKI